MVQDSRRIITANPGSARVGPGVNLAPRDSDLESMFHPFVYTDTVTLHEMLL